MGTQVPALGQNRPSPSTKTAPGTAHMVRVQGSEDRGYEDEGQKHPAHSSKSELKRGTRRKGASEG